jgi:hypothetical protein
MRTVFLFSIVWVLTATILAGCADDESSGNNNSSDSCPNLAGVWNVVQHCETYFVGQAVTISQSGCDITYADPFPGWVGSVAGNGDIVSTGTGGGETLTCDGNVVSSLISLQCQPGDCQVTLQRQ